MATKKKAATESTKKKSGPDAQGEEGETRTQLHEAYEKAVEELGSALKLFNKGDFEAAKAVFDEIAANNPDEPVLVDRARTYSRICERKNSPGETEPQTADEKYYRAVLLSNGGQWDEAIRLLDEALQEAPSSAKFLYARASARALQGNVDSAVNDLRQAITVDPQIRFQATNDSDFEGIREEPAFIDIIEPTPTGA